MKRIRTMGLCLVALFALSAMFVASAQAKKSGAPTGPVPFTSTSSEKAVLTTPAIGGEIECATGETDHGTLTGPKTDEDVITFTGCTTLGKKDKCGNPTAATEEITTEVLKTAPGSISEAEAGTEFTPAPSGFLAQFECEVIGKVKVKGNIIAKTTPDNVMTESTVVDAKVTGGKQDPENFEGGPKTKLEAQVEAAGSEYFESFQDGSGTTHNTELTVKGKKGKTTKVKDPAEIRKLPGKDAPVEYGRCNKVKKGPYTNAGCTVTGAKGKFVWVPV